jgi:bifunctional DNA-binding transcriptional regulator/antitoxin component of YhaV-PrlF toxin-antitoxin module
MSFNKMEIPDNAEQFLGTINESGRVVVAVEVRKKLKLTPGSRIKAWVIKDSK